MSSDGVRMADNLINIRLHRLPSARDLEYFALRYLKVNAVYAVPLEVAKDLVEFGYASPEDVVAPLSDISDSILPDSHSDTE